MKILRLILLPLLCLSLGMKAQSSVREYWIATLDKIAYPVLSHLSKGELKAYMPIEKIWQRADRTAHLEAFGRTLCGLGPWMELGPDETEEGRLRKKYIEMTLQSLDYATDPESPDFMNFRTDHQPLADAAYLAQGLLRCRTQVWDRLAPDVQQQVAECLASTRSIYCKEDSWLLYRAMIETFLMEVGLEYDSQRIDHAVDTFLHRYIGDGVYCDEDLFSWDYGNSFTIQSMLVDILSVLYRHGIRTEEIYETIMKRAVRYASVLEMYILPDGTVPPIGPALTYRTGIFHSLAQIVLMHRLDEKVSPAQVRCGMTEAIKKMFSPEKTFDHGWLRIGLAGAQISLAEQGINTGSLYLCTAGFLPLGLPASDPFWTDPDEEWTSKKIYSGKDHKADKSIY